jgi:TrmH family RNA methyltransferase
MRAFPFEAGSVTRRLTIASTSNERLKAVRRLARKPSRELVLAEGHRTLRCALAAGLRVREVYAAPELFLGDDDAALVARAERDGARVLELGAAAFRSAAANMRPDGILALVERPPTALARLHLPGAALVVVADAIERPGNLGTIVRTACAAGADALVLSDARTDPFHRDVVRGSVGTVFQLPLAAATGERAIAWLREHDLRIVVATPEGVRPYWQPTYEGAIALVVGNERHGVGDAWLHAADQTVAIPMTPPADSLNVAVAAGVVLFEAARSRRRDGPT